jgi:Lipopolysaccharide assembly protein A domain
VPDLSHVWQRFVLALTLLFGLAVGVAATVFGYSNTQTVDVRFAVFQLNGVPLWAVGLVPVALAVAAGTLYHWWNSLHHFTQHMRHRRRVHELEEEVASLRSHLDHFLEIPDGTASGPARPAEPVQTVEPVEAVETVEPVEAVEAVETERAADEAAPEPAAEAAPADRNGKPGKKRDRKQSLVEETRAEAPSDFGEVPVPTAKVEDEVLPPVAPTAGS